VRIRLRGTIFYRPSPRAVRNQHWIMLWVLVRWPWDNRMAYVSKWPITRNTGLPENRDSRERGCLNVILPTQRCVNYLNGLRQPVGTRGDAPGCMLGGNRQEVVEEPKQGGRKQFRRFG
jgi:hypothetical protein